MNVEKLRYTKKEACYALAISLRSLDYMIAGKKIDRRWNSVGLTALFRSSNLSAEPRAASNQRSSSRGRTALRAACR